MNNKEKVYFSARPDFIDDNSGKMYWKPVFYTYKEKGNTEKNMEEHVVELDFGYDTPEEAVEGAQLAYKILKTRRIIKLGEIELKDTVYVSDPCYGIDVWCMGSIGNLKPGKYIGFMAKSETDWGTRVTDLWVVHEEHLDVYPDKEVNGLHVGVDSGSAGIYDKEYYEHYHPFKDGDNDKGEVFNKWYDMQFDERYYKDFNGKKVKEHWDREQECVVRDSEPAGGLAFDNKCVISFSGYGDGSYTAYTSSDASGKVVGIRINYL